MNIRKAIYVAGLVLLVGAAALVWKTTASAVADVWYPRAMSSAGPPPPGRLVIVDTETTGLDPDDRVIEIAGSGQLVEGFGGQ